MTINRTPAEPDEIHVALLSGLLSHLGLRDAQRREYQGARGARFAIFPGSSLARRSPTWVMVGRAGGDVAAVGPDRGAHRAALGRAARRAPGQAHLQRAALGRRARRRSWRRSA